MGEQFLRVEAAAFPSAASEPVKTAVRIGITRADGQEVARVIDMRPESEEGLLRIVSEVEKVILQAKGDRLAVLYRLLWDELGGMGEEIENPDDGLRVKGQQ